MTIYWKLCWQEINLIPLAVAINSFAYVGMSEYKQYLSDSVEFMVKNQDEGKRSPFQAFFIYFQYVILWWRPRRQPGHQAPSSGCPAAGETREAREKGSSPPQGRATQRPPQKPRTSEPRGAQARASTTQVLYDCICKCTEVDTMPF